MQPQGCWGSLPVGRGRITPGASGGGLSCGLGGSVGTEQGRAAWAVVLGWVRSGVPERNPSASAPSPRWPSLRTGKGGAAPPRRLFAQPRFKLQNRKAVLTEAAAGIADVPARLSSPGPLPLPRRWEAPH